MKLKNFMKKKIKIFITGGSGYIGSHIINSFHKHTNIKIYNFDKRVNHEIKNKNCKNIKGNIKNLMKYKNIIKKCNYFFHLAASKRNYKSLTKPYEYFNNNIDQSKQNIVLVTDMVHHNNADISGWRSDIVPILNQYKVDYVVVGDNDQVQHRYSWVEVDNIIYTPRHGSSGR